MVVACAQLLPSCCRSRPHSLAASKPSTAGVLVVCQRASIARSPCCALSFASKAARADLHPAAAGVTPRKQKRCGARRRSSTRSSACGKALSCACDCLSERDRDPTSLQLELRTICSCFQRHFRLQIRSRDHAFEVYSCACTSAECKSSLLSVCDKN